jgi:hypothetical protein
MERVRRRLSYANVVATLALVVAVGGIPAAVAVTKSSSKSDVNKKGNIRAGRVTAAKLAGIDVVQVTGAGGTAVATCPGGERLLAGGAQLGEGGAAGRDLTVSAPEGNGWRASGGAGTASMNAFALCLRATPGS